MQCRAVVPDFCRPSATARAGAGPSGDSGRGRAAPRPRMRDRSRVVASRDSRGGFVGGSRNGNVKRKRCVPLVPGCMISNNVRLNMVCSPRPGPLVCRFNSHDCDPFATKSRHKVQLYRRFLKCNLARHQDQQPARLPRCGMPVRYVAGRFFRVRIPEETANRHQLSI